jgi:hypothetical protein
VLLSAPLVPAGTLQSAILFTSGGLIVDEGSTASGLVVTSGATLTISAGETASGTTILAGGTLDFTGTSGSISGLSAAGAGVEQISLATGSTLDVTGDISSGQTIVFSGSLGVLGITDTANIAGTIDVTGTGAIIDITDLSPGQISFAQFNTLNDQLLITYGTASILDLTFANAALTTFELQSDGHGGTDIDMPCFAAGTHLLTENGEVRVEDIKVGDVMVTVREDGPVTRRVVWTGRRAIDITRHAAPDMVRPLRIIAGAFGPNVPERDLRLSPLHAVFHNGHLFEAISLVNGTTIYQEQLCTHVTYHHIELDAHDVLLAEGLPVESFLDTGNRNMFENVSGLIVLHPDFAASDTSGFCAPLVSGGPELEAIRAVIAAGTRRLLPHAA